jgi:hypothetical protein
MLSLKAILYGYHCEKYAVTRGGGEFLVCVFILSVHDNTCELTHTRPYRLILNRKI